jgi:urease accessory protein
MLSFIQVVKEQVETATSLTLPLESRIKSRLRVTLDDGREAGLFLPRGSSLRDGDCLLAEDGTAVRVRAAPETVSEVRCEDPLQLARACYHLGNRHVPLQIAPGLLRYQHDHVLDDMVRGLGLSVTVCQAPFEPEPGAYGGHGHAHNH